MMVRIRPARPDEWEHLSGLALRSKGYWGYDDAFLEACRDELTISPQRLAVETVLVAETDSAVVGFASVVADSDPAELLDLFVEPGHIGTGVGVSLWRYAIDAADRKGAHRLRIEADPNAEAWYRKQGAVRIKEAPSCSIPGRFLPVLEFDIRSFARPS